MLAPRHPERFEEVRSLAERADRLGAVDEQARRGVAGLRRGRSLDVGQLWLAGVVPGLMMAAMFIIYIWIRCRLQPHLGPAMADTHLVPKREKLRLLGAGLLPLLIFAAMMDFFLYKKK